MSLPQCTTSFLLQPALGFGNTQLELYTRARRGLYYYFQLSE
jgi:hypothetical protein